MCELFRLSPCASGKLAYLIWMTTLRYLAHAGLVAIAVSAGLGSAGAEAGFSTRKPFAFRRTLSRMSWSIRGVSISCPTAM